MRLRQFRFIALLTLTGVFAAWCQPRRENDRSQQDKPYVLLISLDGFRYDYGNRYHPANILKFAKNGVAAKALTPSFPTTTFPNHYTIATGLYPEHHGIVENEFWDRDRNAEFRYNVPATTMDGAWWGGTPLWVLAEQQGMRSACFFWPGSDTEIQHTRATYSFPYDGAVPNERRVAQIVEWIKLPKAQRPHFLTLYFSDIDHESHDNGPDSDQTRAAVLGLDRLLGVLFQQIRATRLPINIFIVSDHGMVAVSEIVQVAEMTDWSGVNKVSSSTEIKAYSRDSASIDALYDRLKGKNDAWKVYRRNEIPSELHYSGNDRIGDLVVFAIKPILFKNPPREGQAPRPPLKGMHGYEVSRFPEMRGIFYAQGPNLKRGMTIEQFDNIHIYPLIAHILGLKIPEGIDGKFEVLKPILRH